MILIKSARKLQEKIRREKLAGKTVSFVPTMGALHPGHASLIRAARKAGEVLVVSIFVNPAQFGPKEDYKRYPKTLKQDKKILRECGVDILFYPNTRDIYPRGYSTYVIEDSFTDTLCGLKRPGHFRGVTTIVLKLFNIVQPDIAFFGQKDYQQALVIKKMVKDLNLPVRINTMPIVREKDGLAMSSRNRYLSPYERKTALCLYQVLKGKKILKKIPGVKLDYFTAVDKDTLESVKKIKKGTLLAIAGWVGKTRLIDNIII